MPEKPGSDTPGPLIFFRIALRTLFFLALAPMAVADDKLYIFTENYPPYNASTTGQGFAHNREDITGICTDMVKTMMDRVDYEYVMKMRDWSRAYEWVQGRENHALFCTARTDEREDEFQWVGPLAPTSGRCLRRLTPISSLIPWKTPSSTR